MKILRKAGTVLLAAVMCLSSFFAENVQAQEQTKGHIKGEVELYSVYTSSETWTCQKSGWYRIWCVGASGDGGNGASGQFTSNKRHCRSGSGGNSGAIAISDLYFKKGVEVPMTIDGVASFGEYMTAEAGVDGNDGRRSDSAPSTSAPYTTANAFGGNILNASGFRGGDECCQGGNEGGRVGVRGGSGARYADTKYTISAEELADTDYLCGGGCNGKSGGSYKPWSFSNMHHSGHVCLSGAGGGGESGRDSGHRPDSNHSSGSGGKGQPALIIFEKAVAPTEPEIMVTPDKLWLNHLDGSAAVTLFSDELDAFEDAKLMYSFDNSSWTEYSTQLTVEKTATIYGKVTFADGQSETSQKEIKIDPLSPSISSANVDETDMEHRFLTVTAKDTGGSGVKCIWIDDTPYTDNPCTYPIPDGQETVMLKVEDVAGNLSKPKEQVVRHIDTIPPTIDTVDFTKDLSVVTIRMSDDTYGDGVKGVYINGEFKTGNPILWAVPEDVAILRLQAEDQAGNKSEIRREHVPGRMAILDTITIESITFSDDNATATVTAATSEPGTTIRGIYCNEELVEGNPVTYKIPIENSQYLKVQAVNNEGDRSELVTKRVPGWTEVTDNIAVTSVEFLKSNTRARVRADTTRKSRIMGIYVNKEFYDGNPIECPVTTVQLECQAVDEYGDLSQPVVRQVPAPEQPAVKRKHKKDSGGGTSSTTRIFISDPELQKDGQYRIDISAKDSECDIEKIVAVYDGHKEDVTKSRFLLLDDDTFLQVIAVNDEGRMTYKKVHIQLKKEPAVEELEEKEVPISGKSKRTTKSNSYSGSSAPAGGMTQSSDNNSQDDTKERLAQLLQQQRLKQYGNQPAPKMETKPEVSETICRTSASNRPGVAAVAASVLCFLALMVMAILLVVRQQKASAYCKQVGTPKKG